VQPVGAQAASNAQKADHALAKRSISTPIEHVQVANAPTFTPGTIEEMVELPQASAINLRPIEGQFDSMVAPSWEELRLLELVNADRAQQGIAPLGLDLALSKVARSHSRDMCERGYFGHFAPTLGASSPTERYTAEIGSRPVYTMIGENVYYRSATDNPKLAPQQAENAFLNSDEHRENLMQPKFTKVGIGFYRSNGRYWVTQMFMGEAN
jgi:uncharacterized protein YkwD